MHANPGFQHKKSFSLAQIQSLVDTVVGGLDTDDVPEGLTNLYYTAERVDDRVSNLLVEGAGIDLSYNDPANTLTITVDLSELSTTTLPEGSNLYYTDERAQDAVGGILVDSATIDFTYADATPSITAIVKTASINDTHIDFGTGANQVNTADVPELTNLYYTDERVDDRVANLIQNGTGITWSYSDAGGTLTPTVTITQYTDELAQDAVGTILTDSATIDFTYSDATPSITASVIQSGIDHGSISGLADDDHTQYHTDARALTWLGTRSTTDLPEGTRLYYTDERVDDRVNALLVEGAGIDLTYDDTANTLTIASTITQYTDELAQDAAAAMIQNGTGITWSYNDVANTLTPTVTITQYTDELAQDAVGTIVTDTATINFTYSDATPSITADVIQSAIDHGSISGLADDDHTQYHTDGRALTWLGTRSTTDLPEGTNLYYTAERVDDRVNSLLVAGTNITLTYDDPANTLTIDATGGSYTDEQAQDAVGTILVDTATIDLVYADGTPSITANVLTVPVVDAAGDTTTFLALFGSATGNLAPLTDAELTYNANTNALSTTTFIGALTGNASTATALQTARQVGGVSFNGTADAFIETIKVIDAGADTTTFVALWGSATGNLQPLTDGGLTYNANSNALTAGSFIGPLTGNADTATLASTVTVSTGSGDTTCFVAFTESNGGNLSLFTDAGLTYNPVTDKLFATTVQATDFLGNASTATLASTVTVADAAADTTTFVMLAGSATGSLPLLTDASLTYDASANTLTTVNIGATGTFTVDGNFTANGTTNTIGNAAADDLIVNCDTLNFANNVTLSGNIISGGEIKVGNNVIVNSATAVLGYSAGAGSSVTQATNKATGVTLNNPCGQITMNNAALAAAAEVSFTLTNSMISATDTVIVNISSGATTNTYTVTVDAVAAGSCRIKIGNDSTSSRSEAIVLNYAVINAVAT